jgi:hypothetical protein
MPIGGGNAGGGNNFLGYVWFLDTSNIIFFRVNELFLDVTTLRNEWPVNRGG